MVRTVLFLVLASPVATGCGGGPGPEARARELFGLLRYADQEGWDQVQDALHTMLSDASRARLAERCGAISDALGREVPASRCLVFGGFAGGRTLQEVVREEDGEARVRLRLVTERGSSLVDFVREDGEWRLDLLASLELVRAGYHGDD